MTMSTGDLAREAADPERLMSQPPQLALTVPDVTQIEPGAGATLQVSVHNHGDEADQVELRFVGPDWAWLAPRRVRVKPGASVQVRLSAAPPRRAEPGPGRWPYTVFASSLRDPSRQAAAESVLLTTSSSAASTVRLEPSLAAARGPAKYILSIANDSDTAAPAAVELIADRQLRQEAPATAAVAPGMTTRLELTVSPRRPRLLRRRDHDFSVVVQVRADPPARLMATYRQLPHVPAQAIVLLALLTTLALVVLLSR
jgi:hypothetical protein